jgi:ribosomal-protein-alanine N-acetyltransferase
MPAAQQPAPRRREHLFLRPMTLDDIDMVAALDNRAFGDSGWSRRYFAGELTDSPISIFYVLTGHGERIIGYFGVWHVVDQLHLCTFAVDPDRHSEGLGAILLNCVVRLAQRLECELIQLEVRESNHVARSLYRSRGFDDEGRRANLYSNPREDGVLMSMATPVSTAQTENSRSALRWPGSVHLRWDDRAGANEECWPSR